MASYPSAEEITEIMRGYGVPKRNMPVPGIKHTYESHVVDANDNIFVHRRTQFRAHNGYRYATQREYDTWSLVHFSNANAKVASGFLFPLHNLSLFYRALPWMMSISELVELIMGLQE